MMEVVLVSRRGDSRWLLASLTVAFLLAVASESYAGGFAAARFGGAYGTSTDTNPTAWYYNPAATAFSTKGTDAFFDLSLAFRSAEYIRTRGQISPYQGKDPFAPGGAREKDATQALKANAGSSKLFNTIALPMVGITTDFGTGLPFRLGAAFFIPFGGSAVWGKPENADELNNLFPGAGDGTVRWYSIDGTIQTLSGTLGASYLIEPIRLSLGATLNLYYSKIDTLRARNSDGTDNLADGTGNLKEGRSLLKASSFDIGMGVGAMMEVLDDALWIGLSWQSRPNFTGRMKYKGTLTNLLATAPAPKKGTEVLMASTVPDVYRIGIKGKITDTFTLKFELDWTRWSVFQEQCLLNHETNQEIDNATIDRLCKTSQDGTPVNQVGKGDPEVIQVFRRNWNDTYKLRLDAEWKALSWLAPTFGVGYDSNAIPDTTLDPALMDMNKFTVSAGSLFSIVDWFDLGVTLTDVIYLSRDTSNGASNHLLKGVSKQPGNGGYYAQNIFVISTSAFFAF